MTSLVYLHGFLSSPESSKAQLTKNWLAAERPDLDFVCPNLSSYPQIAFGQLMAFLETQSAPNYLIGSSLGGYWATILVEQGLAEKAVLVNPAVLPGVRLQEFVGLSCHNYYNDDVITLNQGHIDFLVEKNPESIVDPSRYWLMVQKGDKTLNYRHAVTKYQGSRQLVEEAGSHTFDGYGTWLPELITFFDI